MSTSSNVEVSTQEENQDQNINKRVNEKIRRQQENYYLEELSQLVSGNLPEFSDSDDSSNKEGKLERGSILRETVERLRTIQTERGINKDANDEQLVLPKQVLGSLVLEALDGFMFIVNSEGKVEFISENAQDYLGRSDTEILGESIYNFVYLGDHARLNVNLQNWEDGGKSDNKKVDEEESKIFNVRFQIGKIKCEESQLSDQKLYEDMQVSAMHMLAEKTDTENSNAVMCIARRLPANEACIESPVESFTTQIELDTWTVTAVDTSGLPKQYVEVIGPFCVGKKLTDIVHPQDASLLKVHLQKLQREGVHISRVYRLLFPAPHYTVFVKTKSRIFKPDTASAHKGFVMSTHNIVRDSELKGEDLAALSAIASSDNIKTENGSPSHLMDPSMYGKIKVPIGEDVIISSTEIAKTEEGSQGIDLESILRGDPEAFAPMFQTAAKAFSISPQSLQAMMPRTEGASRASTDKNNSQNNDENKQSLHERLTQAGLKMIPSSQLPRSNFTYSLTSLRSRHPSGRQASNSPAALSPSPSTSQQQQQSPSPRSTPVSSHVPTASSPRGGPLYHQAVSPRGGGNSLQHNNSSPSPQGGPLLVGMEAGGAGPANNQQQRQSPKMAVSPHSPRLGVAHHHVSAASSPRSDSSPNTLSPATVKNERLTGLLSNTLNVRSPSPVTASKSGQPTRVQQQFQQHQQQQLQAAAPMKPQQLQAAGPMKPQQLQTAGPMKSPQQPPPHQTATSKPNQLLKELLTAKENLSNRTPTTETISLRQLLKGKQEKVRSESELLRRLNEPAKDPRSRPRLSELSKLLESRAGAASKLIESRGGRVTAAATAATAGAGTKLLIPSGSKRTATSPDQGPSAKQSPSSSTMPSLESLLRKDVPSPVTTGISAKWSEIPNKSLPRTQVINKFNKPDPGEDPGGSSSCVKEPPGGGLLAAKLAAGGAASSKDSAASMDQSSTQELPSELFDLDLSELDSMMSPDLLSAVDNVIMSEDQAQISAIEQQLMQVEKNINSTQSALPALSQCITTTSTLASTSTYSSPSSLPAKLNIGGSAISPGGPDLPSGILEGGQYQPTAKTTSNTAESKVGVFPAVGGEPQHGASQSIEDLMKRVPPNVTMKPGLDGPGRKDGIPPMRHLSGDTLLGSGRVLGGGAGLGGGGQAMRNANRHASGDSAFLTDSVAGGGANNAIRRYSGDSILLRRLDPGSVSPRMPAGRSVPGGTLRQSFSPGQASRPGSGFSPDQSPRPGSGFVNTPNMSPDVSIPMTIGSTNVGTIATQRGFDSGNKAPEGPSGRSLTQEDLETLGLSIEVGKDDFYLSGALSNNKQQPSAMANKSSQRGNEAPGDPVQNIQSPFTVSTSSQQLQQQQQQKLSGTSVSSQQPTHLTTQMGTPTQQISNPVRGVAPLKHPSPVGSQQRLTSPVGASLRATTGPQQGPLVSVSPSTSNPGGQISQIGAGGGVAGISGSLAISSNPGGGSGGFTGASIRQQKQPGGNLGMQQQSSGHQPGNGIMQYQITTSAAAVNSGQLQQQGRVMQTAANFRQQQPAPVRQQGPQQNQQQQQQQMQQQQQQQQQQFTGGRLISSASAVPANQRLILSSGGLPTQSGGTVQLGSTSIQLASRSAMSSSPGSVNQMEVVSSGPTIGLVTISSQSVSLHQNFSQVSLQKATTSGQNPVFGQPGNNSPDLGQKVKILGGEVAGIQTNQGQTMVPQRQNLGSNVNQPFVSGGAGGHQPLTMGSQVNQGLVKQLTRAPVPQSVLNQQKSSVGTGLVPGISVTMSAGQVGHRVVGQPGVGASQPSFSVSTSPGGPANFSGSNSSPGVASSFAGSTSNVRANSFVGPSAQAASFPTASTPTGSGPSLTRSPSVLQQALSNPPSILQSALSSSTPQTSSVRQAGSNSRPDRMVLQNTQVGTSSQPGFASGSAVQMGRGVQQNTGLQQQQIRPPGMRMVNPGAVMQANHNLGGGSSPINQRTGGLVQANQRPAVSLGLINQRQSNQGPVGSMMQLNHRNVQTNQAGGNISTNHQNLMMASNQGSEDGSLVIMTNQGGGGVVNRLTGQTGGGQVIGGMMQQQATNQNQNTQQNLNLNLNQNQVLSSTPGGVLQAQLLSPPGHRILDGEIWPSFKSPAQDSVLLDSTLDKLLQDS